MGGSSPETGHKAAPANIKNVRRQKLLKKFQIQGLSKEKLMPIISIGMEAETRTEGTVLVFVPFYKIFINLFEKLFL